MQYNLSIDSQKVLCVSGKIFLNDALQVCNEGKLLIDTLPAVHVDLSGVVDADSGSMAVLIEWLRVAQNQHKDIVFKNMPQFMLDLGRVCGLDTVLPIEKLMHFKN